jgi:poly-gamma-glutamate synthesis protein (capsule biosynthesis protein)
VTALLAAALLALATAGCTGRSGAWQAGRPGGPASAQAPPEPTGNTLTILGSGDMLLHPDLWDQGRADNGGTCCDFRPLLASVKDVVSSADLAICHMETPLAPASGPFSGFPRFSVPPQIVPALADLGYDSCSTASNHTVDQGEAGVDRTIDAFDAAGIKHAGSYRTKADHDTVTMLDVRGVKVAHLSYTFSFNGLTRPAGREWEANLLSRDAVLAEAHRARAQGAAIVVVSIHWGTEYQHGPNSQQLSLAKQILASPDVDLILGHHAHVVQPFEKIGDKWVAYGMGNMIAHHAEPINDNREGVLSRFTFTEATPGHWRVSAAEAIPVWMDLSPRNRLVNIAAALGDASTPAAERSVLSAALGRIRGYLLSRGAGDDGLVIAGP